jgi:hypothetical protein
MNEDAQWHSVPEDALPGQLRIGDFVQLDNGAVMRIIGRSTTMLRIRPIRWWERVLRFVKNPMG